MECRVCDTGLSVQPHHEDLVGAVLLEQGHQQANLRLAVDGVVGHQLQE